MQTKFMRNITTYAKYSLASIAIATTIACSAATLKDTVSKKVADFLSSHKEMSVIYEIDQGDNKLASGVQGFANRSTQKPNEFDQKMAIASGTKTMTAAIILKLQEKGMLTVHDSIVKYLDDNSGFWPGNKAPEWAYQVTIHHLLNHTSGIENYIPGLKFDPAIGFDAMKKLVTDFACRHPVVAGVGEKYYYSNTNYFILGLIIEKVTGQDVVQVFHTELFEPLGMKDTYLASYQESIDFQKDQMPDYPKRYFVIPNGDNSQIMDAKVDFFVVAYADGGVVSTASDMIKWNKALHGGKVLSPQSYKMMTTPYLQELDTMLGEVAVGYGMKILDLGEGKKVYFHSGMSIGIRSENGYSPATDISFVLLSNLMPIQNPQTKQSIDFSNVKNQIDIVFFRKAIFDIIKDTPVVTSKTQVGH